MRRAMTLRRSSMRAIKITGRTVATAPIASTLYSRSRFHRPKKAATEINRPLTGTRYSKKLESLSANALFLVEVVPTNVNTGFAGAGGVGGVETETLGGLRKKQI